MDFCIYDENLDTIQLTDKKLLHFKLSKSGQILHVDKTFSQARLHILLMCKIIESQLYLCWSKKSKHGTSPLALL